MEVENIRLIGTGGIGSYFVKYLFEEGVLKGQFKKLKKIEMWDPDVIEPKNALYTTYDCEQSNNLYKVDVLKEWIDFQATMHDKNISVVAHKSKATVREVLTFGGTPPHNTMVVCAIDGSGFRAELLQGSEHRLDTFKKENIGWIDLRSVGDEYVWARNPVNADEFADLLPIFDDMKLENTSCQHKADLDAGIFQLGNRIVALIGVQLLQNINRGKTNGLYKINKISEF